MHMFDIKEELKKLPEKPGVYLMKDVSDTIIYVGKAINLKNRVRQYFQSLKNQSPKTQKMVPQIKEFEYIVTDSELEALILECNLIKRHRPKYNILLKDDKHFFPPYQGAPLMNSDFAKKNPKVVKSLNKLAGKISAEDMQKMNYQVSVKNKKASVVAHDYLVEHNLLK